MMHDAKKSEAGIVAMKAANNGAQARAELPERRAVDQVRRAENKRLRAAGDERLSGTKYDWLRHPASFSEDAGRAFSAINRTSSTPAASTAEDSVGPRPLESRKSQHWKLLSLARITRRARQHGQFDSVPDILNKKSHFELRRHHVVACRKLPIRPPETGIDVPVRTLEPAVKHTLAGGP